MWNIILDFDGRFWCTDGLEGDGRSGGEADAWQTPSGVGRTIRLLIISASHRYIKLFIFHDFSAFGFVPPVTIDCNPPIFSKLTLN